LQDSLALSQGHAEEATTTTTTATKKKKKTPATSGLPRFRTAAECCILSEGDIGKFAVCFVKEELEQGNPRQGIVVSHILEVNAELQTIRGYDLNCQLGNANDQPTNLIYSRLCLEAMWWKTPGSKQTVVNISGQNVLAVLPKLIGRGNRLSKAAKEFLKKEMSW
jgi:hypothetical protein